MHLGSDSFAFRMENGITHKYAQTVRHIQIGSRCEREELWESEKNGELQDKWL